MPPIDTFGWIGWALLAALFAALTAIFAKIGVEDVDPDIATLFRTIVVIVALTAILFSRGQLQHLGNLQPPAITFLTLSGLATGASWVCYFRALQLGEAARVAPLDKLSVVLVAVFGATLLGEKLSASNWFGIAMVAAGAWLVALR